MNLLRDMQTLNTQGVRETNASNKKEEEEKIFYKSYN